MKMIQKEELLRIFSPAIRTCLEQSVMDFERLQEIRLRADCPLIVIYEGKEQILTKSGKFAATIREGFLISRQEMKDTLQILSSYSLYAYEEEIKQGFLTISGGHRVGLTGRAVMEHGKVKSLKYISGMNVRLAHQVRGCADKVMPYLVNGEEVCNCLVISPPRCGKTTLLRDMIRQFSNGCARLPGKTVGVVDERSEIGGCYMGIPQNDVGMRTDILDCCPKAEGMMMLVRSMAPDIVAVDEIGDAGDAQAIETVIHCGCKLFATVHGSSLEDVARKPLLERFISERLFDRYLILHNQRCIGKLHSVLDDRGGVLYRGEYA